MKLKAISATVMGLALGTAIAAPATGGKNFSQPTLVQGNSVLPQMGANFGNSGIHFGGLLNADFIYTNNNNFTGGVSTFAGTSKGQTRFSINNANMFVGGNYGIAHGVINLGYADSNAWAAADRGLTSVGGVFLDEAYLNLYNFNSQYPVYLRMGKFYNAYGQYNPYAQIPSLTDLIEAVNATGVEAGYIYSAGGTNFIVNASAFNGVRSGTSSVNNYSVNAGLHGSFGPSVSYALDGGWIAKASDFYYVNSYDNNNPKYTGNAFNVHLGMGYQNFTAGVKWAMIDSNVDGFTKGGNDTGVNDPWALTVDAGYAMTLMQKYASKLGVTYQMSSKAGAIATIPSRGLLMPKYRVGANFMMQLNQYFNAGLTYMYSKDYASTNDLSKSNGHGGSNNIVGLRMGLSF